MLLILVVDTLLPVLRVDVVGGRLIEYGLGM